MSKTNFFSLSFVVCTLDQHHSLYSPQISFLHSLSPWKNEKPQMTQRYTIANTPCKDQWLLDAGATLPFGWYNHSYYWHNNLSLRSQYAVTQVLWCSRL